MSDLATLAMQVVNALPAADATADALVNANGLLTIGKGLAYGTAAGGAGIGIGLVIAATISGIARQPEQGGALKTLMFIGIGFIEFFALVGIAYMFILK
jgi:F-type H+-transporting ATPase subunit c